MVAYPGSHMDVGSRVLLQAIRSLGVAATLSRGSAAELSRSHNPCFSFPTPHEIEVGGKKIVGSAQKRDKEALLQQAAVWGVIVLAVAVLAMGLWPAPLLDAMRPTIEQLVQQMMVTKV